MPDANFHDKVYHMNYLWLDDERPAPVKEGWDWVKDYETFVGFIGCNPVPPLASLDHDLCDQHYEAYIRAVRSGIHPADGMRDWEGCGLSCVQAMIEHDWLPATVVVHTMNVWGQANMVTALLGVGYELGGHARVPRANPASPVLRRTPTTTTEGDDSDGSHG